MSNLYDYLTNHRSQHLKKTMFELLQQRYFQNEQIIERLGVSLTLEKDMSDFMKFVGDVYESAYIKAVNDHKDQLEKAGLVAKIVPQVSKEG